MHKRMIVIAEQAEYAERLVEELKKRGFAGWQLASFPTWEMYEEWAGTEYEGYVLAEYEVYENRCRLEETIETAEPEGRTKRRLIWMKGQEEDLIDPVCPANAVQIEKQIFMFQSAEMINQEVLELIEEQNRKEANERIALARAQRGRGENRDEGRDENRDKAGDDEEARGRGEEKVRGSDEDGIMVRTKDMDKGSDNVGMELQITSFCSPSMTKEGTDNSLSFAKELAKKEKVLFVSLDPYPEHEDIGEEEIGLYRLGFLLHEYGEDWIAQLEANFRWKGQLLIIAGVTSAEDVLEIGDKEFACFLAGIQKLGLVQQIVIDLGSMCLEYECVLDKSTRVYAIGEKNDRKLIRWLKRVNEYQEKIEIKSSSAREGRMRMRSVV